MLLHGAFLEEGVSVDTNGNVHRSGNRAIEGMSGIQHPMKGVGLAEGPENTHQERGWKRFHTLYKL